jgi:hypothetical protein
MEGLDSLVNLRVLNLSDNKIAKIENLKNLAHLESLYLSKNCIGKNGLSDVLGLLEAPLVSGLDLSRNFISDPKILDEVFAKLPCLALIYFMGNEAPKGIQNYRKNMIAKLPKLKYLDDRPVFEDDRRCAEAFVASGLEGERKEREKIKKEKEDKEDRNREAFQEMIRKGKEEAQVEEQKKKQEEVKQEQEVKKEAISETASVDLSQSIESQTTRITEMGEPQVPNQRLLITEVKEEKKIEIDEVRKQEIPIPSAPQIFSAEQIQQTNATEPERKEEKKMISQIIPNVEQNEITKPLTEAKEEKKIVEFKEQVTVFPSPPQLPVADQKGLTIPIPTGPEKKEEKKVECQSMPNVEQKEMPKPPSLIDPKEEKKIAVESNVEMKKPEIQIPAPEQKAQTIPIAITAEPEKKEEKKIQCQSIPAVEQKEMPKAPGLAETKVGKTVSESNPEIKKDTENKDDSIPPPLEPIPADKK